MNSLEILKHELAEQKSSIESKGGTVSVANTNVSPSEITAGIKSIPVVDFGVCTAVESDVLLGKTFYAGNNILKTGTLIQSNESEDTGESGSNATTNENDRNIIDYLVYSKQSESYPNLELHFPDDTTHIKAYLLHDCKCKADVYIGTGLQSVGESAFYQGVDTTIHDLDKATSLSAVETHSFRGAKGVDLSHLPSSLTTLGNYCFHDCAKYCNSIVVPPNLTTIGTYAFSCSQLTTVDSIDLSQSVGATYGMYFISGIKCYGHLQIPEGTTTLSSYFNQNGSIREITFPTTFTKLNTGAFHAKDTVALEDIITETITFLNPTPPSATTTSICPRYVDTSLNFKIFVPDQSVDAYKAVSSFSAFVNHIFPMSQKP